MTIIDQTFDADSTPVNTEYGVATSNGHLHLVAASFSGKLPPDEMPTSVTVTRGGPVLAKAKYIHHTHKSDLERRNKLLSVQVNSMDERNQFLNQVIGDLKRTIDTQQEVIELLNAPLHVLIARRIKSFFMGRK